MKSLTVFKHVACAALTVGLVTAAVGQEIRSDPTGVWCWVNHARDGQNTVTNTLMLKVDGASVTGTLSVPDRDGNTNTSQITDGKMNGQQLSFTATRTDGDRTQTMAFNGIVTKDTIKGTVGTDRNGEQRSHNWYAKRETGPVPSGQGQ